MKRNAALLGGMLVVVGAVGSAWVRIHDEARHRSTALVADWAEMRQLSSRETRATSALLGALKEQGIQAIIVQPLTLDQLWQDRRIIPVAQARERGALDTTTLRIPDPALASLLYWEWTKRGVTGLMRPHRDARSSDLLLEREGATFLALKDLESAFDVEVLSQAKNQGVRLIFRISQDPWLSTERVPAYIDEHPLLPYAEAILWNTDTPLGGWTSFDAWKAWMGRRLQQTLLFEFKPPRSQRMAARALPHLAQRAHTIAVPELREMRPEQEMARWRRAALERSCRFLLVHASPDQSMAHYLAHVSDLKQVIQQAGLSLGWPMTHAHWKPTPAWFVSLMLFLAFGVAAAGPLLGFLAMPKKAHPLMQFFVISAVTLACALTAAALANGPETRLQTTPFRGVKVAFLIGWLGSFFAVYPMSEIGRYLGQSVRRVDVLLGAVFVGVLGYMLMRTGNVGSGWVSSFEQPLRDHLESWFVVRPRFKEFVFGHPLLLAGLLLMKRRSTLLDPRLLIFLGMIGQASMVNTFAHLHSPLALAISRSFLGLGFGVILGWLLNRIVLSFEKKAMT